MRWTSHKNLLKFFHWRASLFSVSCLCSWLWVFHCICFICGQRLCPNHWFQRVKSGLPFLTGVYSSRECIGDLLPALFKTQHSSSVRRGRKSPLWRQLGFLLQWKGRISHTLTWYARGFLVNLSMCAIISKAPWSDLFSSNVIVLHWDVFFLII